jgi:hypothetical protein
MDDSHDQSLRQRADMLSRIACKALEHIEASNDGLEMLILQDPEIATWWAAHKEADRKENARLAHIERMRLEKLHTREVVASARAKLTPEERVALGLE